MCQADGSLCIYHVNKNQGSNLKAGESASHYWVFLSPGPEISDPLRFQFVLLGIARHKHMRIILPSNTYLELITTGEKHYSSSSHTPYKNCGVALL